MATDTIIQSDLAIAPGEYLLEVLEEAGVSQTDLARRTGRPVQAINEIVKGNKSITAETALQFEAVLGVPAHIWTGLESEYQLVLAKQRAAEELENDKPLVKNFPFKEMAGIGWVKNTRNQTERIFELRRFFEVSSLQNIPTVGAYAPAFRHATGRTPSSHAVAAWLCGGEHDAKEIETAAFDRKRLRDVIDPIRALTCRENFGKAIEELQSLLAESGIAFILRPHLPKTYLTGATFWLRGQDKAALMMSIRGSWADIFWFTLLHEICHILKHKKRSTFVDFEGVDDPEITDQEAEADAFARDTLIPAEDWQTFVGRHDFSADSIFSFAERLALAPGIVTGRLQREQFIPYTRHDFRTWLRWA
ncbi:MAG: HigA family addiction module antitoxin [Salinisphaera sp.]|jgi:HTH-type transcriptional regulator/antitoxin HigA|nr:HigA family addiction module antitoxin [Salinisphaera sp.]